MKSKFTPFCYNKFIFLDPIANSPIDFVKVLCLFDHNGSNTEKSYSVFYLPDWGADRQLCDESSKLNVKLNTFNRKV